ncbi:MAG: hypothetical protein WA790_06440 [Sulfitobacter sp.]
MTKGQATGMRLVGCIENVKDYNYTLDEYQVGEEKVDWHIFSIPKILQSKNNSETANLSEDEIMITTYCAGTDIYISMVLSDNRNASMETVKKFLSAMVQPATLH